MTAHTANATATDQSQNTEEAIQARQRWMAVLARTERSVLETEWSNKYGDIIWNNLREPQIGMVMVRGRAGGAGQRFNLGEMTVTRCAVTLSDGTVGHSYIKGRDRVQAQYAALFDAVMLRDGAASDFIDTLAQQQAAAKRAHAHKVAATKVDFFTLVRGEDE
ncbi:phosphonate C-P lyase system protein PhnG [Thalassospira lohafexi]|uniref:Phosphonate C-P lyase system protein PhnG n=1 Tax=Thalassospira lohafexi TaxID=744227 RepID=A0A2N3L579_9PROT|nr:phosphonate C-P lyase system protein PhnG [Thalassospira lohafexi]PKR57999.1 phosphonate C-P lyase system protein PhnG [Thalassospira lohafexi]